MSPSTPVFTLRLQGRLSALDWGNLQLLRRGAKEFLDAELAKYET
jgi:hypothetical protein